MKEQVKKGAASFYAVIFTALMMSVVALSFVRLMLSEQTQTSGDDLSTSAYDAALAGVEDAKALLKYCAQNPSVSKCANLYADDCSSVSQALYGEEKGSVDESGDQEYTCVKMSNVTDDYRVTIAGDQQRVAMVPLKANGTFSKVKIEWSSSTSANLSSSVSGTPLLPVESGKPSPALVTAQLISGDNSQTVWNGSGARSSLSVFYPALSGGKSSISSTDVANAANLAVTNSPYYVNCVTNATKTTCSVTLEVAGTEYDESGDLLLLGTPYGGEGADFTITLLDSSNKTVQFKDAQVSVDSTGRTNDRYRRVEARVSMTNTSLYPEFTLQLSGDGDSGKLSKAFYVTKNCWRASNGDVTKCQNSGDL